MARLRGGPLRRYSYTAAVEPDIANDWVGNEHPHPSNSKQLTCFSTGGDRVSGGETWAPSARSDTTIKEKQMELNASTPTGFITTEVGLSDGTPIPTPEGWTLLGDIARGDRVFDPRGRICAVTEVDRQGVVPVHEVRFDDGATLLAGGRQEWITISARHRERLRDGTRHLGLWATPVIFGTTTHDLGRSLIHDAGGCPKANHSPGRWFSPIRTCPSTPICWAYGWGMDHPPSR